MTLFVSLSIAQFFFAVPADAAKKSSHWTKERPAYDSPGYPAKADSWGI